MKIIFLDIDGVVSTFEYKWRLDINKLLLLNNIIYETIYNKVFGETP